MLPGAPALDPKPGSPALGFTEYPLVGANVEERWRARPGRGGPWKSQKRCGQGGASQPESRPEGSHPSRKRGESDKGQRN